MALELWIARATCILAPLAESYLPPHVITARHIVLASLFDAGDLVRCCETTLGRLLSTVEELREAIDFGVRLLHLSSAIASTDSENLNVGRMMLNRRRDQDRFLAGLVDMVSREESGHHLGPSLK